MKRETKLALLRAYSVGMRGDSIRRLVVLGVAGLLAGGCHFIDPAEEDRRASAGEVAQRASDASAVVNNRLTRAQLEARVRQVADLFAARWASACENCVSGLPSIETRQRVHQIKLEAINSAYLLASGANPEGAFLNILVLVALQTEAMEAAGPEAYDGQQPALLDAARSLEVEVWGTAELVMSDDQRTEFRLLVDRWLEENPSAENYWSIRFADFDAYTTGTVFEQVRGGVINMPRNFLDVFVPVASTQETVDTSYQLAERMSWLAPRQMQVAQWRAEALVLEMLADPDMQARMTDVDEVAEAATRVSETVERVPDVLAAEREAWVEVLETQQGTLRELMAEVRSTIESGRAAQGEAVAVIQEVESAAGTLTQAVEAADQLMARLEPDPDAEPGRPFDIREYTAAAEALTDSAEALQRLLADADALVEQGEITQAADARVDHVFWRAVQWLALLALVGAGWIVLAKRVGGRT